MLPGVVYVELTESEVDDAEELRDRFGLSLDDAKSLILCRKLRAKKFITGTDFPEELNGSFEGTRISLLSSEFDRRGL